MTPPTTIASKPTTSALPTAFHDVNALMEVTTSTWESVLRAAGEPTRLDGGALDYDQLWHSLTTHDPGKELLDALEVIHELGTDDGRDLLQQAAADQQITLGSIDDEPAREFAARLWIESRSNTPLAEVLVRARANSFEVAHVRSYRDFVGKSAYPASSLDKEQLRKAVSKWCVENQKSEAIEVYAYERDGELRCEILRGDPIKRVVEIRNGRPSILDFRPAASDHIRYDPETGRLGIATRSSRLLQMYRGVLGSLLTNDVDFFSGENICTLRPLQEKGRELFERRLPPGILSVDVVELRWRRGDRDKILVHGRDCFRVLSDLGAQLHEGELTEAKLSISFPGNGRRGHVSLKVPNRIDIKAGVHESLVEQLLDDVGIRGAFGIEDEKRDLWSLYPWRMREESWRRYIGPDFDRLLQTRLLLPTTLETAAHPDHSVSGGTMTVAAIDATTFVGTSDDPAVGLRTLTSSDLLGYELDVSALANKIALALKLGSACVDLGSGIWSIGRRIFSPTLTLSFFLITRKPAEHAATIIRDASKGARPILVIPQNCSCVLNFDQITCRLPNGHYDALLAEIVEQLELQDFIPPPEWIHADLILDQKQGRAWLRHVELIKLQPNTQPFKFAVAVAGKHGQLVSKADLNELLSPKRDDDETAKEAKRDFIRAVEGSFEAVGIDIPIDLGKIFLARGGGYCLNVSARVLP